MTTPQEPDKQDETAILPGLTAEPPPPPPPPAAQAVPPNPFTPVYKQPWIAPNRRMHVAGVAAGAALLAFLFGLGVGVHADGDDDRGPRRDIIVPRGDVIPPGNERIPPGRIKERPLKTVTVTAAPTPVATPS